MESPYLSKLLDEITRVTERNGKGVFRINEKINESVVCELIVYFSSRPEYSLETRKCARCSNTWDIIVTW